MKRMIHTLALLFTVTILFSSCVKSVELYVDPIVGSWVLSNASKGNANGWQSLNTGLETGVFTFYTNGGATYNDGYRLYQGNWSITTVSSGYYDYYGNYYVDYHNAMQVSLRSTNGITINLYFDDVDFSSSNYFSATYYRNYSVERYGFRRY
jgi:hypothetical protein